MTVVRRVAAGQCSWSLQADPVCSMVHCCAACWRGVTKLLLPVLLDVLCTLAFNVGAACCCCQDPTCYSFETANPEDLPAIKLPGSRGKKQQQHPLHTGSSQDAAAAGGDKFKRLAKELVSSGLAALHDCCGSGSCLASLAPEPHPCLDRSSTTRCTGRCSYPGSTCIAVYVACLGAGYKQRCTAATTTTKPACTCALSCRCAVRRA